VQLSPALAKFVIGGVMPFMKARGIIWEIVSFNELTTHPMDVIRLTLISVSDTKGISLF
jgi:hypothetical protein